MHIVQLSPQKAQSTLEANLDYAKSSVQLSFKERAHLDIQKDKNSNHLQKLVEPPT